MYTQIETGQIIMRQSPLELKKKHIEETLKLLRKKSSIYRTFGWLPLLGVCMCSAQE